MLFQLFFCFLVFFFFFFFFFFFLLFFFFFFFFGGGGGLCFVPGFILYYLVSFLVFCNHLGEEEKAVLKPFAWVH